MLQPASARIKTKPNMAKRISTTWSRDQHPKCMEINDLASLGEHAFTNSIPPRSISPVACHQIFTRLPRREPEGAEDDASMHPGGGGTGGNANTTGTGTKAGGVTGAASPATPKCMCCLPRYTFITCHRKNKSMLTKCGNQPRPTLSLSCLKMMLKRR